MATLLEVLKDKQSRSQIIKLLVILFIAFIFTFTIGFFAAFVYNATYPREYENIYNQLFETPKLKEPVIPVV